MHWRKNLFHAMKVVWALNNYNGHSSYRYVIERLFYFLEEIELDNTKSYYADIGCLTEAAFLSTVWCFFANALTQIVIIIYVTSCHGVQHLSTRHLRPVFDLTLFLYHYIYNSAMLTSFDRRVSCMTFSLTFSKNSISLR